MTTGEASLRDRRGKTIRDMLVRGGVLPDWRGWARPWDDADEDVRETYRRIGDAVSRIDDVSREGAVRDAAEIERNREEARSEDHVAGFAEALEIVSARSSMWRDGEVKSGSDRTDAWVKNELGDLVRQLTAKPKREWGVWLTPGAHPVGSGGWADWIEAPVRRACMTRDEAVDVARGYNDGNVWVAEVRPRAPEAGLDDDP